MEKREDSTKVVEAYSWTVDMGIENSIGLDGDSGADMYVG